MSSREPKNGRCRAVLFDLDGTLLDSHQDVMRSVLVALADQGVSGLDLAGLAPYAGYPLGELYAALVPGGDARGLQRFVHIYRAHYCDHCADHTRPFPGVAEALEALADRPLAVATAKPGWSALQLLERLGLAGHFQAVLGSERHRPKPDPGVLLAAASRLGVEPAACAMVGDTDRDLLAARAAGMRAVAVGWGGWPAERLAALRPDALVRHPAEIPEVV